MLRAHVATGGSAAVVTPGTGTAHRVCEQLADADTPAAMLEPGEVPKAGRRRRAQGPAARRRGAGRGQPRRDHRNRSDRQPGHRAGRQAAGRQAPQRRRPARADRGRPGGARSARHRPVRRDGGTHRRRCAARVPGAGVRVEQARWRVGQAVRADGLAGPAVALRRRRSADAEPAGRQRLGQHQDQGTAGRPRDRQRTGVAVRQAAGVAGARVRPGHPVAGRDGGRVRLHRDGRPAHRHHRGQGRYGEADPDGPGDLRRRRLRQDRDRGARGVQGGAGRQAGGGAGADDAAGRPAPADVQRTDGRASRSP